MDFRDPTSMELAEIGREISELASHIYAATCRWLQLVAEFDRREGWTREGYMTAAQWLSHRCGVAPETAREQVRVACALDGLPRVTAAFARGELSYSKVRAITRIAGEANEEALLDIARSATAAQLERVVRGYRRAASADLETANLAHAKRFLRWQWDDDGSLVIKGRLAPEDGAVLIAAIERAELAAREEDGAPDPGPEPAWSADVSAETHDDRHEPPLPTHEELLQRGLGGDADPDAASRAESPRVVGRGARAADALVRVLETAMASEMIPAPRAGLGEVVLHLDAGALTSADDFGGDRCHFEDGPALPTETARRLSCDATVVAISERNGGRLDVGRATRTISAPLRRALRARDGGCRFPGCTRVHSMHGHHVEHWARGGRTDRDNVVLLCPFHHRLVHEGGFTVARRSGDFIFRRPDGSVLEDVPRMVEGHASGVTTTPAALHIDAETAMPTDYGPLDLHYVVGALFDREEHLRRRMARDETPTAAAA